MSRPTEVIIYRNPLEYQLYNSGILFPLICAAVVTIVLAVVLTKLAEQFGYYRWGVGSKFGYFPLALAFAGGGFVLWWML
jgi:hypothetical protein